MAAPMRRSISACLTLKNRLISAKFKTVVARTVTSGSDDVGESRRGGKAAPEKKSFKEAFSEAKQQETDQDVDKLRQIFAKLTSQVDEMKEEKLREQEMSSGQDRGKGHQRSITDVILGDAERAQKIRTLPCRTQETNPANHTKKHAGLFYKVSTADANKWLFNVFHREYYKTVKAFRETSIMVREPGVELINYLKMADYNMPVVRYMLFGHLGAGKSHTMGHAMHYCGTQGWMMVHVRWLPQWNRYPEEIVPSTHNPDRFDTPREGVEWLAYFRDTNEELLKSFDPQFQHRYEWSKREATEIGDSWMKAIEFGLGRPNYACDVVGALLKELKLCAVQGKFKLLVAVDGANGFFVNTAHKRELSDAPIHATDLTLTHNFKKLTKNDWTGGAIIVTVDDRAGDTDHRESFLPKYLLQAEDGFEHFDPHIPIHVPHYNDKEIHSAINYYIDNKWIQNPAGHTDAGKDELIFMSCKNPLELYKTSRLW